MKNINPDQLDRFHDAIFDSTDIDLFGEKLVLALFFLPEEIIEIGKKLGI